MGKRQRKAMRTRARDRPTSPPRELGTSPFRGGEGSGIQAAYARGVRGANLTWTLDSMRAAQNLASSETIYAAVLRIANALGTMPVHLYKGTERMIDDPRDYLLSLRPNKRQSAFEFKRAMEICRNTEGRAYAVKRFNAYGQLAALECLDPLKVTPLEEETTGEIWYCVSDGKGGMEYLHNWYVLEFFHASTNGVSGVRVMDVLAGTVQYGEEVKKFSLENLKNVSNAIVMQFPTTFDKPRRERAVNETLDIYRQNGGKIIALDAGVTASMLGGSGIDPAAFDVDGVTRRRVATVLTLPPHILGDYGDVTSATIEGQNLELLTMTMTPIVQQWIEQLDYKMLTPQERREGWEYRFDMEAYLRADGKTMAAIGQSQIRCGLRTPNELRAKDHLAPKPGGDVLLVSKDLAPVELVAKGGTIDLNALNGEKNSAKGAGGENA
ncbi:MAG: phage portal protein [Clostridia bacterium]|nr:phage portal protein [Clostridia bacterium]